MKLTQQDMARLLDIDARTLRNWKTTKPFLYKIIIQGFSIEDVLNSMEIQNNKLREIIMEADTSHKK